MTAAKAHLTLLTTEVEIDKHFGEFLSIYSPSNQLENNVSVSLVRNPSNFHGSSLPAEALVQAGAPSGHGVFYVSLSACKLSPPDKKSPPDCFPFWVLYR
jgi:hypothetical protein